MIVKTLISLKPALEDLFVSVLTLPDYKFGGVGIANTKEDRHALQTRASASLLGAAMDSYEKKTLSIPKIANN